MLTFKQYVNDVSVCVSITAVFEFRNCIDCYAAGGVHVGLNISVLLFLQLFQIKKWSQNYCTVIYHTLSDKFTKVDTFYSSCFSYLIPQPLLWEWSKVKVRNMDFYVHKHRNYLISCNKMVKLSSLLEARCVVEGKQRDSKTRLFITSCFVQDV